MKKRIIAIYCFLLQTILSNVASAQCGMQPLPFAEKVANASIIVGGKIIDSKCTWDELHQNIYTVYDLQVSIYYKGETVANNIIQIAEAGGIVGLQMDEISNGITLHNNDMGVFLLTPSNDPFSKNLNYQEVYAGQQGVYLIDGQHINSTFEHYDNATDFYNNIQVLTGEEPIVNVGLFIERQIQHGLHDIVFHADSTINAVSPTASISSFSPSVINAGTFETLTIIGTGFGSTMSNGFVQFANANSGGGGSIPYIRTIASNIISWSNTQIVCYVPSGAGTGVIRVGDSTNFVSAPFALTVPFNITSFKFNIGVGGSQDSFYIAKQINDNAQGGYSMQAAANFVGNASALADYMGALQNWRCATGINWKMGANTAVAVSASDGINIVRFDSGTELPAGVLGTCRSRYSGCSPASGVVTFYLSEIDVTFDSTANFFYGAGTIPFSSYDFYSVALHEMGHGHQIGHNISTNAVMFYAISNNFQARTLNALDINAGKFMIGVDSINVPCSQGVHKAYACNPNITVNVSNTFVVEGSGAVVAVEVSMDGVNDSPVTVDIAVSGDATAGADYTNFPTSFTIQPGSRTAIDSFIINDDFLLENTESIIIDITNVTNGVNVGLPQIGIFIIDDESSALGNSAIVLNGKSTASQNVLSWTTTQENNNSYFNILRSTNGKQFSKINTVVTKAINGTSNQNITYQMVDNPTITGTYYYQVEAIAVNNSIQKSNIIELQNTKGFNNISLFPNPSSKQFSIQFIANKPSNVEILLQDVSGKVLYSQVFNASEGNNVLDIPTSQLASGLYLLNFKQNQLSIYRQLLHTIN